MRSGTAVGRIAGALRKRIQRFYDQLNRGNLDWCYHALDPILRESPTSVTPHQYMTSLERFLNRYGIVKVLEIGPVELHLDEPNRLYKNRDFAVVQVVWEDRFGERHRFRERWVRDRRGSWYTRCSGLLTPDS